MIKARMTLALLCWLLLLGGGLLLLGGGASLLVSGHPVAGVIAIAVAVWTATASSAVIEKKLEGKP